MMCGTVNYEINLADRQIIKDHVAATLKRIKNVFVYRRENVHKYSNRMPSVLYNEQHSSFS